MQKVEIGRASLVRILREAYLGFINEQGVQPTHIRANQEVLEILSKVYSWDYPVIYLVHTAQPSVDICGKLYQLIPIVDNDIELFELSLVA